MAIIMASETKAIPNKISHPTFLSFLDQKSVRKYHEKYPSVMENRDFQNWINKLISNSKSGFNKKRFSSCITTCHRFEVFTKASISNWLDSSQTWSKLNVRERGANPAILKLIQFRDSLIDKVKDNRGSINALINLLKSLHTHCLGWELKLKANTSETIVNEKISQTKEQIRLVLNALATTTSKALKICLSQSGTSISDMLSVYYTKEIKSALEKRKPFAITKSRTKNNHKYFLCFSSEMVEILRQMVKEYEVKVGKPKPVNQALFVEPKMNKKHGGFIIQPYKASSYRQSLRHACSKVGIETKFVNARSDRRFFKTQMADAGMPAVFVEAFLGHDLKLDSNYYTTLHNKEKMLEVYLKYVDAVQLSGSEQTQQLKEEVKEYQSKFETFTQTLENMNEFIGYLQKQQLETGQTMKRMEGLVNMLADKVAVLEARLEEKTEDEDNAK